MVLEINGVVMEVEGRYTSPWPVRAEQTDADAKPDYEVTGVYIGGQDVRAVLSSAVYQEITLKAIEYCGDLLGEKNYVREVER